VLRAHSVRSQQVRALLPAALVIITALAWNLYYDWRVTGDPLLTPYILNMRTYSHYHPFLWQADTPEPVYHHDLMRRFHAMRRDRSDMLGLWLMLRDDIDHYTGSLLLLPLLAAPWILRSRKLRGLFIAALSVVAALATSVWIRPHYLAPAMAGFVGIMVQAFRWLAATRVRRLRAGIAVAAGLLLFWTSTEWLSGMATLIAVPDGEVWPAARAAVQQDLEQNGLSNLVIVRYDGQHDPNNEWVYNGADLADAPVLWARDMGPERNRELLNYFKDRKVWLLQLDAGTLTPYPVP
jgi:hypothetical protein